MLIDELLKTDIYYKFYEKHGLKFTQKELKVLRKRYQDSLKDSKLKNFYNKSGARLNYFYEVSKSHDMAIRVNLCRIKKDTGLKDLAILELINQTRLVNRRIRRLLFRIPYKSKIRKNLSNAGAVERGLVLLAKVEDGIDYLSRYEFDEQLEFSTLKKSDLKEIVKLEYGAHKYSDTSRCGTLTKKSYESFYRFILKTGKKNILVKENGEIIGTITYYVDDINTAKIMSIAVHPKHQKRGVAKLLYFKMLQDLKKQKVKCYFGVSTTAEVLGLAKRLKRKAVAEFLEIR